MKKVQGFSLFLFLQCFLHYKKIQRLIPFSLFILCFTSLLCKTGTTIFFVDILEFCFLEGKNTLWEQLALLLPVLVFLFLINYITCFLFKFIIKLTPTIEKEVVFVFDPVEDPPPIHEIPWKEKIYLSFTNVFIASGLFKETRYQHLGRIMSLLLNLFQQLCKFCNSYAIPEPFFKFWFDLSI